MNSSDLQPENPAVEQALTSLPPSLPPPVARRGFGLALGVAVLALLGAGLGLFLVSRALDDARSDMAALQELVADLGDEVAALRSDVADLPDGRVAQLPVPADGTASAAPNASTGGNPTGLPRFDAGTNDAAVGLVINAINGVEYYSDAPTEIRAGDGKARAWFVWAHWCPYCQQEMPLVAEWVTTQAAAHPNMEVISISTAMDPTATNPLEPYLDEGQYPFPVLVDRDGALSAQLGVSAFPFWVFTAPDGSVLGRAAGLLDEDRLASIFAQLQELGAEAAG